MQAPDQQEWTPIVLDIDSGEVWYSGYVLWTGERVLVPSSYLMVLRENVRLYQRGKINANTAKINELTIAKAGTFWVDRPDVMQQRAAHALGLT